MNLLLRTNGDIAQVTYGGRPMADRDVADRQLAGMNAVEPIAVVILARVQMHVRVAERFLAELLPGFDSRTSRLT